MDHREINAAADEIARIIALDPEDIDDAAIASQYDRWQQAGLAIRRLPVLRDMTDRLNHNITRIKGWPRSDSTERDKLVSDSQQICRAMLLRRTSSIMKDHRLATPTPNQAMQRTAGRRTASLRFMKTPPLQATLVDSFGPRSVAATLRLYRLPRGFPARGVLASGG
jgi:hypothetical protein